MNAKGFLDAFGHIANSPVGVVRLRELILQMAVQGRLVPQSELEESAEAVLLRVDAPTRRASRRRGSGTPPASHRRHSRLPKGWRLIELSRIAHPQAGFAFKSNLFNQNKNGLPIIRVRDVGASAPKTYYSGEFREEFVVSRGDWLIAMDGDFRIAAWEAETALLNQRVTRLQFLTDEIDKKFVCIALQHELRDLQGVKNYTTVDHLSGTQIAESRIPFPPPGEQVRIVAKVNELMSLCDKLERDQQDRRMLQNLLRHSILQAVATASSPHELQTTWARVESNFGRLFGAPKDVDDFVASLKDFAVRGLLVSQSDSRPDLDAIRADCSEVRLKYIDAGIMRRQKIVGGSESDVTYPDHWSVAAFDEVAIVLGGVAKGRNLRGRNVQTLPYLAVANVQRGYFKMDVVKSIEIGTDELAKYLVHEGDLLITEGGDWDKVGRTAIWRGAIESCVHQNHIFKARVPSELLLNEWVELVFNSGVGRDYFAGASKQTTNLASINMTQLRSFPLPIPPEDEQRRILAMLGTFTAQCAEWRQLLERKQAVGSLLASATVSSLTGIKIEGVEDEAMKAPQTELIAPLYIGTPPDVKAQAPLATLLARHSGKMSARDLWQRFGGEVDVFYSQLKAEVAHGWILEPAMAEMREKSSEIAGG